MNVKGMIAIPIFLLLATTSFSAYGHHPCDSILSKGIYNLKAISKSSYHKHAYARAIASFSKEQAEKKLGLSGNAVVYGVPVGGSYSKAQYRMWQKKWLETIHSHSTSKSTLSYLAKTIDPKIVEAWSSCMYRSSGGLLAYIEPVTEKLAALVIEWRSPQDAPLRRVAVKSVTISGAKYVSSREKSLLKNGTLFNRIHKVTVQIKRTNKMTPVLITVNVQDRAPQNQGRTRSVFTFLPSLPPLPKIPPKGLRVAYKFYHPLKRGEALVKWGTYMRVYDSNPSKDMRSRKIGRCYLSEDGTLRAYMKLAGEVKSKAAWGDSKVRKGKSSSARKGNHAMLCRLTEVYNP
jgi:hypothetical protein